MLLKPPPLGAVGYSKFPLTFNEYQDERVDQETGSTHKHDGAEFAIDIIVCRKCVCFVLKNESMYKEIQTTCNGQFLQGD